MFEAAGELCLPSSLLLSLGIKLHA